MILQALTSYYQALEQAGTLAGPGWGPVKVSYALSIASDGTLEQIISVKTEQARGKKTVLAPQVMTLPAPVKRSSGIAPNFLCDNATYILGADDKGKPQRARDCFAACRALHEELLKNVESPAAQALLAFFRTWEPAQATSHPALAEQLDDILSDANLTFLWAGNFIHEDPAIRRAWERYYGADGDGPSGICLVTGEEGPVERVHPAIKNVRGAQSSGAALVSFNAPAFCSYGKEQNLNAPTVKYAAFAYTAALNHLLADREHVFHIGDTTVVCWAQNGQDAYQSLFSCACLGGQTPLSVSDIQSAVEKLCQGAPAVFEETLLDPSMNFYILGLSPNASRLSVRFFMHNSFGAFIQNIQAHYDRLKIVRPAYEDDTPLYPWRMLSETVNQNTRDKSPAPNLAGEVLRAIFSNSRYPASLLNGVTLRIRAERDISWRKAAIIKAYYLQNTHSDIPKEVLTVSLNPQCPDIAYTLGRLFSVLESIQSTASPNIKATIKDKYFSSAASTPATVFPILVKLAQNHLKKIRTDTPGLAIILDKQVTELMSHLDTNFPSHMNLAQQGAFQIGYYHQTQARYEKKEDK